MVECHVTHVNTSQNFPAALPSPGFYPEISGFFEAVGILLGILF
jgi:hypothetical protein